MTQHRRRHFRALFFIKESDADLIETILFAANLTNADLTGSRIKNPEMGRTKIDGMKTDQSK